jgi:hypothetical protein
MKLIIQCDYPVEAETMNRVAENEMSQFCCPETRLPSRYLVT